MTAGYFTFLHHDTPIEWTWNLEEREAYIARAKPKSELAIRLKCIRRVPIRLLPCEFIKVNQALHISEEILREIVATEQQAVRVSAEKLEALDKALRAYVKKGWIKEPEELYRSPQDSTELKKICADAKQVYRDVYFAHEAELIAIALRLVPDAPWDKTQKCLVFQEEAKKK